MQAACINLQLNIGNNFEFLIQPHQESTGLGLFSNITSFLVVCNSTDRNPIQILSGKFLIKFNIVKN